jgi:hypothetical protein
VNRRSYYKDVFASENQEHEMKVLNEFMTGLHAGEPVEFYRLKIMPIFVDEDRKLPFVDLEEALTGRGTQTGFCRDYRDIGGWERPGSGSSK